MSNLGRTASTALCLMLGALSLGCATQATPRSGFYAGLGYRGVMADFTCQGCTLPDGSSDAWEGGSGMGAYWRLGGSVSPSLLLGAEIAAEGTGLDAREGRGSFLVHLLYTGQYYPNPAGGVHITGGMGLVSLALHKPGGSLEIPGFSARLGAGYDYHFKGRLAITPQVELSHGWLWQSRLRTNGSAGPASELGLEYVARFGAGLTWY